MERITQSHAGGVSIVAFIIILAISMGYYQFIYVPQINLKPSVPEAVANPPSAVQVSIVDGSSLPSNQKFFDPAEARGTLEIDNKVIWTNNDKTAHTVTTDDGHEDKLNGKFDSLDTIGLITPGKTYEFTFTEDGEFAYHCEPHPWMVGKVVIVKNFS